MDEAESYLEQHFGKQRPFVVPEGYFDRIADKVVARLPERKEEVQTAPKQRRPTPWRQWRTLVGVAACACVVLLAGTWIAQKSTSADATQAPVTATATMESQDYDFDDVADYVMIDNEDIYALVANN